MRVVCISDLHERHAQIDVPDGDVLVCAGDVTARGELRSLENFAVWMEALPHRHKVLVAGNHDFCFEKQPAKSLEVLARSAPGVTYLQDSGTLFDGVRFWGSPWQPRFYDWAFNLDRGAKLAAKWAAIPGDTEVLVTHGPPFGTLDLTTRGLRVGCHDLARRLDSLLVRLHVFGHIHEGYGVVETGSRISVNASICDERYAARHPAVVVDL